MPMGQSQFRTLAVKWLLFLIYCGAQPPEQEQDESPVLAGYDLVAYHGLERSESGVLGNPEIFVRHDSYVYYFSSEDNRRLFMSNPEAYLPAFGGFGTWGLAYELADDGWPWSRRHLGPACDPRHGWMIYQGVLYCNFSVGRKWDTVVHANATIALAWQRWDQFYGGGAKRTFGPMNNRCYSWNWQICYDESIVIPGLDQNRSELLLFEDEAKSSERTIAVAENVSFTWSLENAATIDPIMVVSMNTTLDSDSHYIAFGVAETLMEGLLILCSPAFRDQNTNAECRTYIGAGMRIEKASEEALRIQMLASIYDPETGEYNIDVSFPLYKIWESPRIPARLIFARGPVVDDVPRGHAMADRWEIELLNLLSVVDQLVTPRLPPNAAVLRSLPPEGSWKSLGQGNVHVLDDRVHVTYEFFIADKELILQANLETAAVPDTYVAFGVSPESMSGLIVTCTMEDSSTAGCQQWRGEKHNLRPLDRYMDPGGWACTGIASKDNGKTISYTIAAYLSDLIVLPEDFDDVSTLRGISAIGDSTESDTPLQHAGSNATSFLLNTSIPEATVAPSASGVLSTIVPLVMALSCTCISFFL